MSTAIHEIADEDEIGAIGQTNLPIERIGGAKAFEQTTQIVQLT